MLGPKISFKEDNALFLRLKHLAKTFLISESEVKDSESERLSFQGKMICQKRNK